MVGAEHRPSRPRAPHIPRVAHHHGVRCVGFAAQLRGASHGCERFDPAWLSENVTAVICFRMYHWNRFDHSPLPMPGTDGAADARHRHHPKWRRRTARPTGPCLALRWRTTPASSGLCSSLTALALPVAAPADAASHGHRRGSHCRGSHCP
jgi:hypothetical protein